jgi:hypothetical protein
VFQTEVVEKVKTHTLCPIRFFFSENFAVYRIRSKNIVEPSRPHAIWRILIADWIPKATNTPSEYVIIFALPP